MNGEGGFIVVADAVRDDFQFSVDFNPAAYNRVLHADPLVEEAARSRWAAAVALNPCLFNASKFRYFNCTVDADKRSFILHLGLTDYADFQGTHSATRALELFGPSGLARPLGNAIVVETADCEIPFLVRASHAGEGRGIITMTGGHPEPEDAGITSSSETGEKINRTVSVELWNAARKEVLEELFVEDSFLGAACEMKFLGLVSRTSDMKTLMSFWAPLHMHSRQVLERYLSRNTNAESTALIFVKRDNLRRIVESGKLNDMRVMPDHVGTIALACDFFEKQATA